jgi:hypothetical protein
MSMGRNSVDPAPEPECRIQRTIIQTGNLIPLNFIDMELISIREELIDVACPVSPRR